MLLGIGGGLGIGYIRRAMLFELEQNIADPQAATDAEEHRFGERFPRVRIGDSDACKGALKRGRYVVRVR